MPFGKDEYDRMMSGSIQPEPGPIEPESNRGRGLLIAGVFTMAAAGLVMHWNPNLVPLTTLVQPNEVAIACSQDGQTGIKYDCTTYGPGNVINLGRSVEKVDMSLQSQNVTTTAYTKDALPVEIATGVLTQMPRNHDALVKLLTVEPDWRKHLELVIADRVKTAIAGYNAEDLIKNRAAVNDAIVAGIQNAPVPVTINAVQLTNVNLPQSFLGAVEQAETAKAAAARIQSHPTMNFSPPRPIGLIK